MVKIREVIEFLEKIDEKWEQYFSRQSTIDHGWHCWSLSWWKVFPDERRIFVVCNSCTKFTKECYKEFQEFKTEDGWTIELLCKHSELDCLGYCEVSKLFS